MTETERFARHLARRISASRSYGDESISVTEDEGAYFLRLPLIDAEVILHIEPDGEHVGAVLSFLLFREGHRSLHLNNWTCASSRDVPVSESTTQAWAKLYEDEQENKSLGRVLWMHGAVLPVVPEETPTPPKAPTPIPPRPRHARSTVRHVDVSIFDLFSE